MLVPKLRFKEFTDEWKMSKLGNCTSFKQGIQVDVDMQKDKPFENSCRFIRIVDYTQQTKDLRYISNDFKANHVDINDVILVRYGATAGFVGHGIKGIIANNMFTVTPNDELDKDYLYTYLKQERIYNKLNNSNGSSAMPALNFGSVSILQIAYPKIAEQKKVSNLISLLDKKIELQTKKIEVLKLYKKGLSNNFFNERNMINWNKKNISELGTLITAKSKINEIDETGIYNIVDMGTVNSDGRLLKHKKTNCSFDLLKLGDLIIPKDDIGGGLIIGKCAYIDEENKYILSDHLYMLRCENENTLFISYQINSTYINQQLMKKVTGSAQLGINAKNINDQSLFFPDKILQRKISNSLFSIDKKIDKETIKIELLNKIKNGLMQNLFT